MVTAHMVYVFVIPRLFTLHASGSPGRLTLDAVGIIVTVAFGYTSFLRSSADRDPIRSRTSGDRPRTRYSSCPRAGGRETDWRLRVSRLVARQRRRRRRPRGHRRTGRRVARGRGRCVRTRCRIGRAGWACSRAHCACVRGPAARLARYSTTFMRCSCRSSNRNVRHRCMHPGWMGNQVECAVAGHLPILRVRNGEVEEVTSPQIAVGMFDGTTFSSSSAECMPGDLFALLTDGLIEVFESRPGRARLRLGEGRAAIERWSAAVGYRRPVAHRRARLRRSARRPDGPADSPDA